MREEWEVKPLKEVCLIKPRKSEARKGQKADFLVSFAPMETLGIDQKYLITNQTRTMSDVVGSYTYFSNGDVLLAKITPCFENGKLGIASDLINNIGFGSSEYIVFRANEQLDAEWLYYYLSRQSFRNEGASRMAGAVGHKRITKDFVEDYPIPVPPLPEQRRIVAILDEAFEGIATAKANAEKNLQNARELNSLGYQSIVRDVKSPDWIFCHVSDIAAPHKGAIRTGPFGSQLLHGEFVDNGIAVLGIDNAVNNNFTWGQRRYITETKYLQLKRYRVYPGDIIITLMGTCGRCAVVPQNIPVSINTKHLCCITLNQEKCLPEYLHIYFLYDNEAKEYLNTQAKGSIMAGLNMSIISNIPIHLPPLNQQKEIIDRFNNLKYGCEHINNTQNKKLSALDELKQSLLHQAFNGDL
ncbi:MAG: restriction endonuclease subunit S [Acidithiobacillus sp.]